jgi:Carbonic anhydrases/acetyltransferases, isoleucine patch superfamily
MVMGNPAKVVRTLRPEEKKSILNGASSYVNLAQKQFLEFSKINN